jgi:ADP-ribose pyrophosphatase
VEHGDCVAIIALDDEDNLLLVEQFRKPVEKKFLEIPAGGIEPGESAEGCVRRELREEVGFLPQKLERLGGFYSSPGYSTEYLHLFLATELISSPLQAEDSESIKVVRLPLSKVLGLINSGEICDAKSIAGMLFFLEHRKSAKLT